MLPLFLCRHGLNLITIKLSKFEFWFHSHYQSHKSLSIRLPLRRKEIQLYTGLKCKVCTFKMGCVTLKAVI